MIDGILDISLPLDEDVSSEAMQDNELASPSNIRNTIVPAAKRLQRRASTRRGSMSTTGHSPNKRPSNEKRRYLFTVKPGGIAGYMCLSLLIKKLDILSIDVVLALQRPYVEFLRMLTSRLKWTHMLGSCRIPPWSASLRNDQSFSLRWLNGSFRYCRLWVCLCQR